MLDVNRMALPVPPQSTTQKTSSEHPATTTTTPHHENMEQTHNTALGTKAPTRPANNRLPRFNQVMEIASLQAPISMNHPVQKDPLDKYSRGITTTIYDTYPGSAYAHIKQEVIDEWTTVEGKTLLAIPFGSDAETPELYNEVGDQIFDAVGKITQSETYGVALPMKEEDLKEIIAKLHHQNAGQKRKRTGKPPAECLPTTFLIHTLSPVHYQILTQQTVWASQNITFQVAPPQNEMPYNPLLYQRPLQQQPSTCYQMHPRHLGWWNDDTLHPRWNCQDARKWMQECHTLDTNVPWLHVGWNAGNQRPG